MLQAVEVGQTAVAEICVAIESWAKKIGKPKRTASLSSPPEGLEEKVRQLVGPELKALFMSPTTKDQRNAAESAAGAKVYETLGSADQGAGSAPTAAQLTTAIKAVKSGAMRSAVLDHGRRMDGRALTDIRPIQSRAGLLFRREAARTLIVHSG